MEGGCIPYMLRGVFCAVRRADGAIQHDGYNDEHGVQAADGHNALPYGNSRNSWRAFRRAYGIRRS